MKTRDAAGILIYDQDENGLITFGRFGGAVPDTADKFAAGCILIGNGKVYSNAGSSAVPSFQDINDVGTGEIATGAVTLAKLASGVTPSHVVKYAGTTGAYGGGDTSNAFTVTGLAATDVVSAVIRASTNAVSIVKAVPTTNTLTIHFSADPGAATTVDYSALRAAA